MPKHSSVLHYSLLYQFFRAGLFQTAYSSLLNVKDNNQPEILIEKAKWYSCQKDLHKALLNLQKGSCNWQQQDKYSRVYAAKVNIL